MAVEPCPTGCPTLEFACDDDLQFAICTAEEFVDLFGTAIEFWHWSEPDTEVDALYAEPIRENRNDPDRWDFDSPAHNIKGMIVDPPSSDPSERDEGQEYTETVGVEILNASFAPTTAVPLPQIGDVMYIAALDRYYDVVKVGKGQWFDPNTLFTRVITLQWNQEYEPDRRLVP